MKQMSSTARRSSFERTKNSGLAAKKKRKASNSRSKSPKRRYDASRDAQSTDEEDEKVSPRGWHAAGKTSDIEKLIKEIDMKKAD